MTLSVPFIDSAEPGSKQGPNPRIEKSPSFTALLVGYTATGEEGKRKKNERRNLPPPFPNYKSCDSILNPLINVGGGVRRILGPCSGKHQFFLPKGNKAPLTILFI